jgi:hypothetical protein
MTDLPELIVVKTFGEVNPNFNTPAFLEAIVVDKETKKRSFYEKNGEFVENFQEEYQESWPGLNTPEWKAFTNHYLLCLNKKDVNDILSFNDSCKGSTLQTACLQFKIGALQHSWITKEVCVLYLTKEKIKTLLTIICMQIENRWKAWYDDGLVEVNDYVIEETKKEVWRMRRASRGDAKFSKLIVKVAEKIKLSEQKNEY